MENLDNNNDANAASSTMSLYQKYADFNTAIEKTRQDRALLEERQEALKEELSRVKQATVELHQETATARSEAKQYEIDLPDIDSNIQDLEKEAKLLEERKHDLQEHKRAIRASFRAFQNQFLRDSKRFREQCIALKGQAKVMALPLAHYSAYAVAILERSSSHFDTVDGNLEELRDFHDGKLAPSNLNAEQVVSQMVDTTDPTLKPKLQEYHSTKRQLEGIQKEIDVARTKHQNSLEEKEKVSERRDNLQKQLDRILEDHSSIKQKTQDQRDSTEEAKGVAEAYSDRARIRSQDAITGSTQNPATHPQKRNNGESQSNAVLTRNPYKKRTAEVQGPNETHVELRDIAPGQYTGSDHRRSLSTRNVRRRRNHRFGSSLVIEGIVDESNGSIARVTPSSKETTIPSSSAHGDPLTSSAESPSLDISSSQINFEALNSILADDDDDDELFSLSVSRS